MWQSKDPRIQIPVKNRLAWLRLSVCVVGEQILNNVSSQKLIYNARQKSIGEIKFIVGTLAWSFSTHGRDIVHGFRCRTEITAPFYHRVAVKFLKLST